MRCRACNILLEDRESVRKSLVTGEYMDMCDVCLGTIIDDLSESLDPWDELWDMGQENVTEDGELPEA